MGWLLFKAFLALVLLLCQITPHPLSPQCCPGLLGMQPQEVCVSILIFNGINRGYGFKSSDCDGASARHGDCLHRIFVDLLLKFLLDRTNSSSKLPLGVLWKCLLILGILRGLLTQPCSFLLGKSPLPFLWMEGYNLRATQLRGSGSNDINMAPPKNKYCISTVHMATQELSFFSANALKK